VQQTKVLIVGGAAIWSIETYFCKYLNQLGMSTSIFNCAEFYDASSIIFKIRNRAGDKGIYSEVNSELIRYCKKERPTIVWVFKGVEIYTDTLQKLKALGVFLANYNPDHPFIRTSISHGGKNIPESVPLYDLHFSYRKDLVKEIKVKYNIPTGLLPFGFELSDEDFNKIKDLPENNRACFIGTPDKERVKIIEKIAKAGYPVDIYGQQYQNKHLLKKYSHIQSFGLVLGLEYWKKIREYRIQLNFFRAHNISAHNQRTFEVPGAGGILLSPDNEDQRDYFTADKEMFFYKDNDELLSRISEIISKPLEEIETIREAARKRSLLDGYTYRDRSSIVFETFKKLDIIL
jgi:hypothetical protein